MNGSALVKLLLQRCATVNHLKQVHAHLIAHANNDLFTLGRLLNLLCNSQSLSYAQSFFSSIPKPNTFLFNTIIRAHTTGPNPQNSIFLYIDLLKAGILPDAYTFPFVLKACARFQALQEGRTLHCHALKFGFDSYLYVGNALIHMYSFNDRLIGARQMFDEMALRDLVSWNSMINGYAKCGDLEEARRLFDLMGEKNLITWSAMISGYVQMGQFKEGLDVFYGSQACGVKPHESILVSVLAACAHVGGMEQGKWVHAYVKANGMHMSVIMGTALMDMYAKCGCLNLALDVFHSMHEKNLMAWTTMIKGMAMHGHGTEALELFTQMEEEGVTPDDITFIGVLCACTHAGLVDKGLHYFKSISEVYGISPKIEHYGCLVDLLARGGRLQKALCVIKDMPMEPDARIWGPLLAGCRFNGEVELAELVANHLIELEPNDSGVYVLLGNIYAASGRHEDAKKLRILMSSKGVVKNPGCSLFELEGTTHQFIVGDTSHPQMREIQEKWEEIERVIRVEGYVPNRTQVLLDVEEEEKEEALSWHSEKMAIAFGLMRTKGDHVIRIVKNLRVCSDCHHVTKLISKVYGRQIVVRDRTRFHHFKEGQCSCNDYW
ncbi:hypothetical protein AMTRI_Chr02g260970 [Amborella trichopoda]